MSYKIIVKRILADIIDWNLIFIIGIPLFFLGENFDPKYLLYPSIKMFSAYGTMLGVLWFLVAPLLKNCLFNSASFGMFVFGLKIVSKATLKKATVEKLILRSATFYLPFADIMVLLITKKYSLGDLISKTTVLSKKDI